MAKRLLLSDNFGIHDDIRQLSGNAGLWARTEVIIGHSYHRGTEHGKSFLDEVLFTGENTVPYGGVQTTFQYLFDVEGPISRQTLYEKDGIGIPNINEGAEYILPNTDVDNNSESGTINTGTTSLNKTYKSIYSTGHKIQLFGIGVTGTAENTITVHKVDYKEDSMDFNKDTGTEIIESKMYPFRVIPKNDNEKQLTPVEQAQYFGKKELSLNDNSRYIQYFLKRFEDEPEIRHVWKASDYTAATSTNETEIDVTAGELEDFTTSNAIESFVEIHLTLTQQDLKEYFNLVVQEPESARFNSIGLFDGIYVPSENTGYGDFANVRLFSKINIPVESLSLSKDLEIIYRIYGS